MQSHSPLDSTDQKQWGSPDHIQESPIFTVIYYLLHLHFI